MIIFNSIASPLQKLQPCVLLTNGCCVDGGAQTTLCCGSLSRFNRGWYCGEIRKLVSISICSDLPSLNL